MEIFVGFAFFLLGICIMYTLCLHPMHKLLSHRQRQIHETRQGEQVYIEGFAGDTPGLTAPFSRSPCIAWRIQVIEIKSGGKRSSAIRLLDLKPEQGCSLRDWTGSLTVLPVKHPKASHIRLGRLIINPPQLVFSDLVNQRKPEWSDRQNTMQQFRDDRIPAFLAEHNIPLKGVLGFTRNLRVKEYILTSGTTLYAWGTITEENRKKCLVPWLVSRHSRRKLVWFSLAFGLAGLLLAALGGKVVHEFALR